MIKFRKLVGICQILTATAIIILSFLMRPSLLTRLDLGNGTTTVLETSGLFVLAFFLISIVLILQGMLNILKK